VFYFEEGIIESCDDLIVLDGFNQKGQKLRQSDVGGMVRLDLLSDLLSFFLVILDASYRFLSDFIHIFSDSSSYAGLIEIHSSYFFCHTLQNVIF